MLTFFLTAKKSMNTIPEKNYSLVFDNVKVKKCIAITSYQKEEETLIPQFEDNCLELSFTFGHHDNKRVIKKETAKDLLKQLQEILKDEL